MAKFNPAGHGADLLARSSAARRRQDAIAPARAASPSTPPATPTSPAIRARPTSRSAAPAPTRSFGGGVDQPDRRFYVKLGPTGAFLYGTYIGGIDYDWPPASASTRPATSTSAAADSRIAAASRRRRTPTTWHPGSYDAFLTKFDAAGTRVYSTFLGGSGGEQLLASAGGLAVDDQGRAYVTGDTYSTDFPTVDGFQTTLRRSATPTTPTWRSSTRRMSGAASLVYSTYLGGTGTDMGMGIAYAGNRAGRTSSARPTPGSRSPTPSMPTFNGGGSDAFVAKFDTSPGRRRVAVLLDLHRRHDSRSSLRRRRRTPPATCTWSAKRSSTDFPQVGRDLDPFQPDRSRSSPSMNARGHDAALLDLLRRRRQRQGRHGRGDQRRRATPTSTASPTPTGPTPPTPTGFPIVNPFQGVYGGGGMRRLRRAHRQRRRPAADQDRGAGAGRDGRHGHLHADDHQPVDRSGHLVTLADPLPAGMTFATCVATAGGVCGGSGNNRTVDLRVHRRRRVGDRDHHRDRDRRHGRDAGQHRRGRAPRRSTR